MRISVSGYGGEYTLGTITKEQHVYWSLIDNPEDINNMLLGWADECETEHPAELALSEFYNMDNIAHANGAAFDSAYITVTDDDGDTLWEGDLSILADKPESADLIASEEDYYFSETDNDYGIFCCSLEKGSFNEIDVEGVTEFDPSRLRVHIEDIEGNRIVSFIEYQGAKCEDQGSDGTTGKGFDYTWLSNVEGE